MKNQPPDFEQLTPHARRAHRCLNDRTLKLLFKRILHVNCTETAFVAKGLKYGWYHRDDVMQFSMLAGFAKTLLE